LERGGGIGAERRCAPVCRPPGPAAAAPEPPATA
jgi:hypothetical protein